MIINLLDREQILLSDLLTFINFSLFSEHFFGRMNSALLRKVRIGGGNHEHDQSGLAGSGGGCSGSRCVFRSIDRRVYGLYIDLQPALVQGIH